MKPIWIVGLIILLLLGLWVGIRHEKGGQTPPFSGTQIQPRPFEPAVELTVCPQGPPACQFRRIQDAINEAPVTAPVVSWKTPPKIPLIHIAPGTYVESLTILKNIWLQGSRAGQVILQQPPPRGRPEEAVTVSVAGSFTGVGMGLEGLTIHGIVYMVGQVSGLITDNRFASAAIVLTGALANLVITGNSIQGGIGVRTVNSLLRPGDGVLGIDGSVIIQDNEFVDITSSEVAPIIQLYDAKEVRITSNRFTGNDQTAVDVLQSEDIHIGNNLIQSNSAVVVYAHRSQEVAIFNNQIEGNEGALVLDSGSYDIEDNRILNNRAPGISLSSVGQSGLLWIVTGNEIRGNGFGLTIDSGFPQDLEALKQCSSNQISGNGVDYAGRFGKPNEELKKKCEGG